MVHFGAKVTNAVQCKSSLVFWVGATVKRLTKDWSTFCHNFRGKVISATPPHNYGLGLIAPSRLPVGWRPIARERVPDNLNWRCRQAAITTYWMYARRRRSPPPPNLLCTPSGDRGSNDLLGPPRSSRWHGWPIIRTKAFIPGNWPIRVIVRQVRECGLVIGWLVFGYLNVFGFLQLC